MREERLLIALEVLCDEKQLIESDKFSRNDEVAELLIEFLESIYRTSGLDEIQNKLGLARKVDAESIEEGLEIIEKKRS